MSPHVVDELPDLLLGDIAGEQRRAIESHLADCPDCAGALGDLRELLGLFAEALPPATPGADLRGRVLGDARGRLARFAPQVAPLLELDDAAARDALDRLDDADAWHDSPMPGTRAQLVAQDGAILRGFIRVPAGVAVPKHVHHGVEHTLVLQGALLDDRGRLWTPGELMTMGPDSKHTFAAFGELDCLCCVVIENGYSLAA